MAHDIIPWKISEHIFSVPVHEINWPDHAKYLTQNPPMTSSMPLPRLPVPTAERWEQQNRPKQGRLNKWSHCPEAYQAFTTHKNGGVVHPVHIFNSILRTSKPLLVCSFAHQEASARLPVVFHHPSRLINRMYEHHRKTVDKLDIILTLCRCWQHPKRDSCCKPF